MSGVGSGDGYSLTLYGNYNPSMGSKYKTRVSILIRYFDKCPIKIMIYTEWLPPDQCVKKDPARKNEKKDEGLQCIFHY